MFFLHWSRSVPVMYMYVYTYLYLGSWSIFPTVFPSVVQLPYHTYIHIQFVGVATYTIISFLYIHTCTLGWSTFAIFSKSIFKIIAQGANDTLFYAEFRTVFLFSLNFSISGAFRFEILKNQRGDPLVKKIWKK